MRNLSWLTRMPFILILVGPFVLLSPVLLSGRALFWGTPLLQFVPWWNFASETLRSGHLPLWNPLVGMGAPLLANYQSALFYPPHWLYFGLAALGGAPALAWGQALLVALHLAWAGTGMALLARRLGMGVLAQTISGLGFGLSGYLVARAGFLSINSAVAWTPWILLFTTPLFKGQRIGDRGAGDNASRTDSPIPLSSIPFFKDGAFFGLVICLAMQLLAGHAQLAWYTLLLVGAWSGYWGWETACGDNRLSKENWKIYLSGGARSVFQAWIRLGLALLLALGLSAIQLLPTAEYLLQSQRVAQVNFDLAMTYSFWPWRILGLLAPGLFGSPVQGDYWGYGNFWEDSIYLGVLPLLLAFSALLQRRSGIGNPGAVQAGCCQAGSYASLTRFLLGISVVSSVLALGKNTPVFPWLYHHVPSFDMFQAPARYLLWLQFALPLLAGIGAECWRRPEKSRLYWTRLGTAGAFAVSLGAGLAWILMGEVSPSFIRATALAGMWGLGAGLLSLLAPPIGAAVGFSRNTIWVWGVTLFVSADLLVAGWGLNPGQELDLYRRPSPLAETARSPQGVQDGRRFYLPAADEEQLKFERFLRFDTFDPGEDWTNLRATMLPNIHMLDNLPSANNFDPLVPGRYARWMEFLSKAGPPVQARWLELMAVGSVISVDEAQAYGVRIDPSGAAGNRWRWVSCGHIAQDGEHAWQIFVAGDLDLKSEVVLEDVETAACQPGRGGQVELISETPNRLSLQLKTEDPFGWLVLSDVWYPGWQARVDGQPVPVLRANYLFRAVPVSKAGQHRVVFEYHPFSFWLGAAISFLAWSGFVWLVVNWRIGRRVDFVSHL